VLSGRGLSRRANSECMLRFGTDYVDRGQDYYERRYQGRVVSQVTSSRCRRGRGYGAVVHGERIAELLSAAHEIGTRQHQRPPAAGAPHSWPRPRDIDSDAGRPGSRWRHIRAR